MPAVTRPQLVAYALAALVVARARRALHAGPGAQRGRPAAGPAARAGAAGAGSAAVRIEPRRPTVALVHVAGAVRSPGVYRLRDGERIQDAVRRAGGPRAGADLNAINLAAKVGRRPAGRRARARGAAVRGRAGAGGSPAAARRQPPVSLNSATAEQLDTLDGVGPATAAEDPRLAPPARRLSLDRRPRRDPRHRPQAPRRAANEGPAVSRARRLVAELRARPWHVGTAAVVAGLLAGPLRAAGGARSPRARRRRCAVARGVRLALVGAVLARRAAGPGARCRRSTRRAWRPRLGHAVRERVVAARRAAGARPFGARVATVRLDGERVLLRTGPRRALAHRAAWGRSLARARRARGAARVRRLAARARRARPAARPRAGRHRRAGGEGSPGSSTPCARGRRPSLRTGVPAPQGALLRGMALGDDAALPDRTRDEFRASGLSHLVAASGQNVMLLAALVLAVAAVLGAGPAARGSRSSSSRSRSTCRSPAAGRRSSGRG